MSIADAIPAKGFTAAHATELSALGRLNDPAIVAARADRLFALLDAGDLAYNASARGEIAALGMQRDPRSLALRGYEPDGVTLRRDGGGVKCDRDASGNPCTRAQSEAAHKASKPARDAARRAANAAVARGEGMPAVAVGGIEPPILP